MRQDDRDGRPGVIELGGAATQEQKRQDDQLNDQSHVVERYDFDLKDEHLQRPRWQSPGSR